MHGRLFLSLVAEQTGGHSPGCGDRGVHGGHDTQGSPLLWSTAIAKGNPFALCSELPAGPAERRWVCRRLSSQSLLCRGLKKD